MKTLFKVWSVLIIIGACLSCLISLLALFGGGLLAGGAGVLVMLIALIPSLAAAVVSFIAALAGFQEDYDKCVKFATIIVIINVISFVLAIILKGNSGSAILSIIMSGIYCILAKKLQ